MATPHGVFALMVERMRSTLPEVASNFFHMRINAELLLRNSSGTREITIDQIYHFIKAHFSLSNETIEKLVALERQTEIDVSIPVNENINLLKLLLGNDKNVALISDFYWGKELIIDLLSPHLDVDQLEKLKIYVSSDWMETKNKGTLFRIVAETEDVEFSEMQHIGDNPHCDIKVAKRLGIKTILYQGSLPIKEEISALQQDSALSQLLLGYGKLLRMQQKDSVFSPVVASIAGPLFYMYLHWICENVHKVGIKKLYFLSRDGQVFLELARMFPRLFPFSIPIDYFYISRRALDFSDTEGEKEALFLEYLHQTDILSYDHVGIVDIGWTGGMHDKLFEIIQSQSDIKITGYYLGMYGTEIHPNSKKMGFIYDIEQDVSHRKLLDGNANFFECLTSADHGSVYGYYRTPDGIFPTLKYFDKETKDWDFSSYRKTLFLYFDMLDQSTRSFIGLTVEQDLSLIGRKIARAINDSNLEIMRPFAGYRINSNIHNNIFAPLIAKLTIKDVFFLSPKKINERSGWIITLKKTTNPIVYFFWRVKCRIYNVAFEYFKERA